MARGSRWETRTLVASAARTVSGEGDVVRVLQGLQNVDAVVLVLDVTAAATSSGDKLDVKVQVMFDGANWIDICAFAQVLGNGGPKRRVAKILPVAAQAMFTDTALTAGNLRHLLEERMRAVWTIADAGGGVQSFTFSVTATPA